MATNMGRHHELHVSTGEEAVEPRNPDEEASRQEAIKQIKRRRKFHIELVVSGIGMAFLVLIWATSEYHNAGGWPTQGFSQSSGIHDVWNYWIIYPLGAWILIMAGRAWSVHRPRGISESEIKREIDRQAGQR
ncbi:MAG: 2TM domain-containing protein [Acidimicrobiales bacterium]